MKFTLRVVLVLLALTTLLSPAPTAQAAAPTPGFVIVNYGDTLYMIAARNRTTVDALVRANGLPNPNFIWTGQRLVLPAAAPAPNLTSTGGIYTVAPGDTLATVAARFGTTVSALMRANGLYNPNFIYTGQRLRIPTGTAAPIVPPTAPANVPASVPAGMVGKWIDINITTQTITAFQDATPLKSVLVSTGVSWHPTPIGRFKVYVKVASQTMSGGSGSEYYYLPGVPWVMYFSGANAIHGTYWHSNFGHPMSHGCVNLTIADAKWFYDWAAIGTPVISHL